jgi:hypothetical protein
MSQKGPHHSLLRQRALARLEAKRRHFVEERKRRAFPKKPRNSKTIEE